MHSAFTISILGVSKKIPKIVSKVLLYIGRK